MSEDSYSKCEVDDEAVYSAIPIDVDQEIHAEQLLIDCNIIGVTSHKTKNATFQSLRFVFLIPFLLTPFFIANSIDIPKSQMIISGSSRLCKRLWQPFPANKIIKLLNFLKKNQIIIKFFKITFTFSKKSGRNKQKELKESVICDISAEVSEKSGLSADTGEHRIQQPNNLSIIKGKIVQPRSNKSTHMKNNSASSKISNIPRNASKFCQYIIFFLFLISVDIGGMQR